MISWVDAYKVVEAMAPLYAALTLGYGSVKWWRVFTPDQAEAINRLVCYFTLPLFAFEFTAHVDPFKVNYTCMLADVVSKVIIVLVLAFWAKCSGKGSYCWSITSFSLTTLTNSLVVGVPLLKAMYGQLGVDLVVQLSVFQALLWLTVLLFVLEIRRTMKEFSFADHGDKENCVGNSKTDLEENNGGSKITITNMEVVMMVAKRPSIWTLTKVVGFKLAMNPNSYACVIGIIWAFLSNRLHFEMPSIMEGSILIMSRAGTGTAMFSMGIFMAMQEKVIACGASLTVIGMALKFIAGPLAMAIACLVVGLHGDVLRIAIIQAALPQSITSFIFAKEYGLHADVLSTAVIFGMIVSLPVLVGYYAALEFVR